MWIDQPLYVHLLFFSWNVFKCKTSQTLLKKIRENGGHLRRIIKLASRLFQPCLVIREAKKTITKMTICRTRYQFILRVDPLTSSARTLLDDGLKYKLVYKNLPSPFNDGIRQTTKKISWYSHFCCYSSQYYYYYFEYDYDDHHYDD